MRHYAKNATENHRSRSGMQIGPCRNWLLLLLLSLSLRLMATPGWDTAFVNSPPGLGPTDIISAMAYANNALYVAVTYNTGFYGGYILKYNLTTQSWSTVPNGDVNGKINALAANTVTVYGAGSITRLFVGGSFDTVGDPGHSITAHNVAILDPSTSPNATWSTMTASGKEGTDGEVWCLSTSAWTDTIAQGTFNSFAVFVGGSFAHVGTTLSANGIAMWKGLSYPTSSWTTFGGGLDPFTSGGDLIVHGLAPTLVTTNSPSYQTSISAIHVTGRFSKAIGANTDYNAAKWTGSAWSYIGNAFATLNEDPCDIRARGPYDTYSFGWAAAMVGTTPYFGGGGDALISSGNTLIYDAVLGCPDNCGGICRFAHTPLQSVGGSGMTWSPGMNPAYAGYDSSINLIGMNGLAAYSSTLYVASPSFDGVTSAFKYASGTLSALPGGSGSPQNASDIVDIVASTLPYSGTSVFFASGNAVYRYFF